MSTDTTPYNEEDTLISPPSMQYPEVLKEEVRKFTFRVRQLGLEVKAVQLEAAGGAFEVKFKSPSPYRERKEEDDEETEEEENTQPELDLFPEEEAEAPAEDEEADDGIIEAEIVEDGMPLGLPAPAEDEEAIEVETDEEN